MQLFRPLGGAGAVLAVMTMALPAEAQSWRSRGPQRHHHHHRGEKVDAGGLILGALLIGGLFAAKSAEKKRREREAVYFEDYEAMPIDAGTLDGGPVPAGDGAPPPTGSPVPDIPAPGAAEYDGLYDQDAAADRCAVAAETQAQQFARLARVTAITDNLWNGKSWVIKGRVEVAESYNDADKPSHKFRCALRAGDEPVVTIEGLGTI